LLFLVFVVHGVLCVVRCVLPVDVVAAVRCSLSVAVVAVTCPFSIGRFTLYIALFPVVLPLRLTPLTTHVPDPTKLLFLLFVVHGVLCVVRCVLPVDPFPLPSLAPLVVVAVPCLVRSPCPLVPLCQPCGCFFCLPGLGCSLRSPLSPLPLCCRSVVASVAVLRCLSVVVVASSVVSPGLAVLCGLRFLRVAVSFLLLFPQPHPL